MRFDLSDEQTFFRETTARFLADQAPPDALRARRDDPAGFDRDYWRRGAELGWTSLLVAEDLGGGSVSGAGLVDATLVAHEFGCHAAPGPLAVTNVVACALSRVGGGPHRWLLDGLLAGTAVATWCLGEPPPGDRLGDIALTVRTDGSDLVLDGVKRPVESPAQSDAFLVVGRDGDGLTQVLVPAGTPGTSIHPLTGVDLTRRFATVAFDGVRLPADAVVGERGRAADDVERQLQIAVVLASAEATGAMQVAFDMTVEWAFERYSFGRPLASYQELKHRFADMKTWLEGSHAVSDAAAAAVAFDAPRAAELASAAKAFTGDYGVELAHDCVQIHGGIGVTFEHDLHLYLRRITMNRTLFGTPADHRRRLTDLVEGREDGA